MNEDETCYELAVHGGHGSDATGKTPFEVPGGEHLYAFYDTTPWSTPVEAVRFEWTRDAGEVIRGVSLFELDLPESAAGTHEELVLDWSGQEKPVLIAALAGETERWTLPDDVGVTLPEPGRMLALRFHYVNPGSPRPDRSSVRICTVPSGTRAEAARLTVFGAEDLGARGLPPGPSTASGSCKVGGSQTVRVLAVAPQLQRAGTAARFTIEKADGTTQSVFDQPYEFDAPSFVSVKGELAPGDVAHTTCEYDNPTPNSLPVGRSTESETCYLFVLTTPALPASTYFTLQPATNHCLQ